MRRVDGAVCASSMPKLDFPAPTWAKNSVEIWVAIHATKKTMAAMNTPGRDAPMELTACNASAEKDCSRLSPIGRVSTNCSRP